MKNVMKTYSRFDANLVKGKGSWVETDDGKKYLDFVAGVAVNCLGHCNDTMINAIHEQSKKLIHVSNIYWNENQIALADKLISLSDHENVFFCNSGTEAIEVGLKIAKKYGASKNKTEILYSENSFHGRTVGALSVTGQEKYQKPFGLLMDGVNKFKFNDIESVKEKMSDSVCAIIIEPIQGEGGIVEADNDFLVQLKELCDENDALLIFDEVQCGIGRTGKFFAYENYGVVPDVVCMAKGLGGGFPIGAAMAGKKASFVLEPGDHGCTFGGSPLACGVSLAVVNELLEKNIITDVEKKNKYFVEGLTKLKEKYGIIKNIQGKGLLLGISVGEYDKIIISKAFEKGLLTVGAGNNVIRIVPALNIEESDIDKGLKILDEVLFEVSNEK
jgi:acetylornithine/N-succinyldiaminopimelate aminotransferase